MFRLRSFATFCLIGCILMALKERCNAFVPSSPAAVNDVSARRNDIKDSFTTTSLDAEFSAWNLNPEFGASPFGFDINAEVWNGRIAQVSFVWVFLQEFIQGKGVLRGLSDGEMINVISFGVFAVVMISLIGRFLAEPPAGWPTQELTLTSPQSRAIRSNPVAYAQAKSVGTLTGADARDPDDTILNFNDRSSPFGLKKNAEIWNGRIAMIAFVWAMVQEFFQREGVISAMERSDGLAMTSFWCAMTAMLGFTGVLSSMEEDQDYVERVVSREALELNAKDPNGWKPSNVEPPYTPIRVSSVTPGTAVSEPVTYERYMQERARLAYQKDFADSLRAMSSDPGSQQPKSYQTYSFSPSTENLPVDASPALLPYGTAYNPVSIQAETSTVVPDSNLSQHSKVTPRVAQRNALTEMKKKKTSAPPKMMLPYGSAYAPVVVKPGAFTEVASPAASQNIDRFWSAAAAGSSSPPPMSALSVVASKVSKTDASPHPAGVFEFKSSMKRAMLEGIKQSASKQTFRVEGYRFKPETQSLIGSSPHPAGTFAFGSETKDIIQSKTPWVPKPKPVAYPVEGFRFGDVTKTIIQKNKDVESPLSTPETASMVTPSAPKVVDVIADGAGLSSSYKAMGSSYLEALNRGVAVSSTPPEPPSSWTTSELAGVIKPAAPPARVGASYLESLGRP